MRSCRIRELILCVLLLVDIYLIPSSVKRDVTYLIPPFSYIRGHLVDFPMRSTFCRVPTSSPWRDEIVGRSFIICQSTLLLEYRPLSVILRCCYEHIAHYLLIYVVFQTSVDEHCPAVALCMRLNLEDVDIITSHL